MERRGEGWGWQQGGGLQIGVDCAEGGGAGADLQLSTSRAMTDFGRAVANRVEKVGSQGVGGWRRR